MDELGNRIIKDTAEIQHMRNEATEYDRQAAALRYEANEIERLLNEKFKNI